MVQQGLEVEALGILDLLSFFYLGVVGRCLWGLGLQGLGFFEASGSRFRASGPFYQ